MELHLSRWFTGEKFEFFWMSTYFPFKFKILPKFLNEKILLDIYNSHHLKVITFTITFIYFKILLYFLFLLQDIYLNNFFPCCRMEDTERRSASASMRLLGLMAFWALLQVATPGEYISNLYAPILIYWSSEKL